MPFDQLVASVTLSGSIISCAATALVLGSYIYYRNEQRSFRHALVFNLALAEFVNTLNNSISGSIYMRDHLLYPGVGCTVNAFVGQMTVQASDFSILLIALVTVLTITRTAYMPHASTTRKTLICLSVWVVPLITATVATALNEMQPVSGNWCWISSDRTDLRYALTHGWRIFIIFITIGIYSYIWWYMARHFRSMVSTGSAMNYGSKGLNKKGFRQMDESTQEESQISTVSRARISRIGMDDMELSTLEAAHVRQSLDINDIVTNEDIDDYGDDNKKGRPGSPILWTYNDPRDENDLDPPRDGKFKATETQASEFPHRRQTREMEREIKRMLLLNAYPIMYVILWIPGLINRFLEASGNRSNSRALAALQASSQFVGLANALTYGFNVHLRKKVKDRWRAFKGKKGRRRERT